MSIWEIIWVIFVAIFFMALLLGVNAREDQDIKCCRNIFLVISGLILAGHILSATREPYVPDPKFFMIWNRSGRHHSKAGWQITNYRKPSAHLPPAEYMMGVEMARSNTCHAFNFSREEDITLFKRCAHFFPEFLDIYHEKHQTTVGVTL